MMRSQRRTGEHWLAAVLIISLAAATLPAGTVEPHLPNPGNPRMTREQQEQLGLKTAAQVYQQMPVLPDASPETKYIQALGKRLAATIPPEHSWPFQFHTIAEKDINAFALPGGPMFVNVGTIRAADNEAELAGVMAHEMGHVYMQHTAKQQEKQSVLGGIADIVGAIAGGMGGAWGGLAQSGIQFGAGTLLLSYSREDEAQADAVGTIILWKAGFDPIGLADFFEKIEAQGSTGPQFLSDHPNPGNRREAIKKEIKNWPPKTYLGNSTQFAAVRKDAESVRVYTAQEISDGAKTGQWAAMNQRNGAVFPGAAGAAPAGASGGTSVPPAAITDVQPSSVFVGANLGTLTINRPENWPVMQGQRSDSATIAPSAGVSGGAVACGVVIQSVAEPSPNASLDQLIASVVKTLEGGDKNMKQDGGVQSVTVNGISGASVYLQTISPMAGPDGKPQRERDRLVTVPRGGGKAIALIFVAPLASFEQMKPTFEKMLYSVQF